MADISDKAKKPLMLNKSPLESEPLDVGVPTSMDYRSDSFSKHLFPFSKSKYS